MTKKIHKIQKRKVRKIERNENYHKGRNDAQPPFEKRNASSVNGDHDTHGEFTDFKPRPEKKTGKKDKRSDRQLPKFLREVDEKEFPLDELKCGICNDYIIDARISQCTHQFCWLCFETHLLKNPLCPICRLNFKLLRISPCLDIDKVIEKFFANSKVFQLRKSIVDTTRVIKRKGLEGLKVGTLIDVRDPELIWCVGKVTEISPNGVKVSYLDWSSSYDETIPLDSDRLACHTYYTSRRNIAKYENKFNMKNNFLMNVNKIGRKFSCPKEDTCGEFYLKENTKISI